MTVIPRLLPRPIQALGLITAEPRIKEGDQPAEPIVVTAAIVTLRQQEDGSTQLDVARMSDAREMEFPLSWLVDQALDTGASVLVSLQELQALAVTIMRTGFFNEERLAQLLSGSMSIVDLGQIVPGEHTDEAQLARSLRLPPALSPVAHAGAPTDEQRLACEAAATEAALSRALRRLIIWAHVSAARTAEPAFFYEVVGAIIAWIQDHEQEVPRLLPWPSCSRLSKATYRRRQYLEDLGHRQAGLPRSWPVFEENLSYF